MVFLKNVCNVMNESTLKSQLMDVIKKELPTYVPIRHEDVRTNGIPDLSLTGHGWTSWWEFKYADPHFEIQGIQELTMLRLARAGFARYVIWQTIDEVQRTFIVHPSCVRTLTRYEQCWDDFNMCELVEAMREVHQRSVRIPL